MVQVAIINDKLCKPNKCNKECMKSCPINKNGGECIVKYDKFVKINEKMCIGCKLCINVCPFNAIKIYNLPTEITENLIYKYGENSFRLYKMLIPKINKIQGIIGPNGIGKSTLIKILSKLIIPFNDDKYLSNKYKGTEMYKYLTLLYNNKLNIKIKPQNINSVFKLFNKDDKKQICVKDEISKYYNENNGFHYKVKQLLLDDIYNNKIATLSGGQMQKFLCAMVFLSDANVYIFDEFTNYLDIEQRLLIANLIQDLKNLVEDDKYIIIIDHDISILDYTCDSINIMYGKSGAYGILSSSYNCLEGINTYFTGYISSDNVKFRDEPFTFRFNIQYESENIIDEEYFNMEYEKNVIDYDNITININEASIINNAIYLVLGKNGSGKTTYLNYINQVCANNGLICSYKKQHSDYLNYNCKVRDYLMNTIKTSFNNHYFYSNFINEFVDDLFDKKINKLSGGELQKVSIIECLGKNANVYLLDEPSANLDVEQRYYTNKIIKKFIISLKKTAYIIEHDIMMFMQFQRDINTYLIHVETNYIDNKLTSFINKPIDYYTGINDFLKSMDVTFRIEFKHKRPRINKKLSQKDQEQKLANKYLIC